MNFSRPIKKIRQKIRDAYYSSYFSIDQWLNQHVIPLIWSDINVPPIKTGDLVKLNYKITSKKYHGIALAPPERVIVAYGVISVSDNVRYIVKVKWNYGKKSFDRYEFCDNLKVISGGK